MQEEMKTVNAYYRKHKTLEGCPVLSAEEIGKLQSSMAVSYTHLDVYKRQGLYRPGQL